MTDEVNVLEASFNRLSQLAGFFEAVASGCTADDYRPIVTADEMHEWAGTLRSVAAQLQAYATAAVRAEREQAAVDALAKMIVRQEALTIKTVEGATHHMSNWRRAREEARELLATLNRVAEECEKGGGDDAR